jgi:hypothetical protein
MMGSMLAGTEESPARACSPRAALQDDPRHGQLCRHAGRLRRPLLPGGELPRPRWFPKASKAGSLQGPVADVLYQMVGGLGAGWATAGGPIGRCSATSNSCAITTAGLRESHPARRDDHRRSTELQRVKVKSGTEKD